MYIYQNELDKTLFHHDMAYGEFKSLPKRTAFDKVLWGKAFNIINNWKDDGHQCGLISMVYKFLDKKTATSGGTSESRSLSIKRFAKVTRTN